MIVDAHAHLFEMKKDYQLPEGIIPVIAGYSHHANLKARALGESSGFPYTMGIAPQTVLKEGTAKLDEWISAIREGKPNAIGEIGLDYKWAQTRDDVAKEKETFARMIALAKEMKKPLVIHCRNNPAENEVPKDAVEDVLAMCPGVPLMMHFYSGTAEQAKRVVAGGGYISIICLRTKERRKTIEGTPLSRLMAETDCPYVGRTPEAVKDAISYIAEVKGIGFEEAAAATAQNARAFFGF